jgi:asparagine synthase (glutamine-hydrolysing)
MFRLSLHRPLDPATLRWHPADGSWRHDPEPGNSPGWIEPFTHPALEHQLVLGPGGHGFIVNRERRRGTAKVSPIHRAPDDAAYARLRTQAVAWPLGFILIDLAPTAVRITASAWGLAPIHLITSPDGALHGSWDLLDLLDGITDRLNPVEVVRFLTYTPVYSSHTLLTDVQTVTERATATFTRRPGGTGRLRIDYPEPGLHALPRRLRQDADPVPAFEDLLAHVIEQWAFTPGTTVADLSGGMDSTNVALTLAQLHPGRVTTGAMILTGPYRRQQTRRRAYLRRTGFAGDHQLQMVDHLPFAPSGPRARGQRFHPQEGPYAEARNLLLDRYAAGGARVVFTGLGGDEAMKLHTCEIARRPAGHRPEPPLRIGDHNEPVYLGDHGRRLLGARYDNAAPVGPTLWSILDAYAALYPHYMRRGLWPINPLAAPQIVRLAESLPADWRTKKRLFRDRLTRLGFPQEVVHPPLPENFQHILDLAMRRHGVTLLESLLDDGSRLVADGYLDEAELRRACRCFAATGRRTYEVYRPLILEAGLRSLSRPPRSQPAPADPAAAQRAGT